MLFARLVVHQHALLDRFRGDGFIDVFRAFGSELRSHFERVVSAAAVAARVTGEVEDPTILTAIIDRVIAQGQ